MVDGEEEDPLAAPEILQEVLVNDKLAEGLSGAEAGVQLLSAVFSLD